MVWQILTGLAAGLLGGGANISPNIEVGTSKKQTTLTDSRQFQSTNNFTDARNISIITNSPNASSNQTPTLTQSLTPTATLIPTIAPSQSSSQPQTASGSQLTDNLGKYLLLGGIGVGAYYFLVKKNNGK